jgi:hypothetical protein
MYTDVQYSDIAGANICGDAQNYTLFTGQHTKLSFAAVARFTASLSQP